MVLPFEAVLKLDQKFQLKEMAYAKKVNFHILSQIVFLTDFGPGVWTFGTQRSKWANLQFPKQMLQNPGL